MQEPTKNIPTVLIILGATGDLMSKKIAPAIFNLFDKGNIPSKFKVIGFSRQELSDKDFRILIKKKIGNHASGKKKKLDTLMKSFSYHQGLFQEKSAYTSLQKKLQDIDDKWGICSNKLFYLAVPPNFYETITDHLSSSGLTKPCSLEEGWTRVLIEKPFGENLKTARKLEERLSKLFREVQIYRIDHYLAKEMLQNILNFRFSNTLFESIWNKDSIERIDIRLLESIGVEKRGAFYDDLGTLRDVGQNHLLQMLALITMEHPGAFDANEIRYKRAQILKTLRPLSKEEIKNNTFRAQYDGYRKIKGVKPRSMTETYFKISGAFLDSPNFQGIPITLESGKRMGEQIKEIVITFKHPTPCLCPPNAKHYKNKITFALEPKESIDIQFWSKKLGLNFDIEKRNFQFLLRGEQKRVQYVEEYEKLLIDAITGDQTLFVSTDEVRAMWAFTDPIVEAWKKNAVPMRHYKPNTNEILEKSKYIDAQEIVDSTAPGLPLGNTKVIGIIGLGKMGGNIARQLKRNGWHIIGTDKDKNLLETLERDGIETVPSLEKLISKLPKQKLIWMMIPAGKAIDKVLFGKNSLTSLLNKNDIIIDGGNSFFKDTIKRQKKIMKMGIHYIDVGVSGGPRGALEGASLMIGGEKRLFKKLEPLFADLSYKDGYVFFEGAGAGHFVKMIHNGIEYGMMQAIAEGFTILKKSSYSLNMKKVVDIYNNGAVIESKLIGWLGDALELYGEDLNGVSGSVTHSGEGEWTVKTAEAMKIKVKIIEESLKFRILSQKSPSYTGKILSALRGQFGGHDIKQNKKVR